LAKRDEQSARRLRGPLAALALLLGPALPAAAQEALDEGGNWVLHGAGSVDVVEQAEAPPGIEGRHAVRCTIDETQKGQAYLRVGDVPTDLTPYARLRFRLFGNLDTGRVVLVTVIDSEWRHRQWPSALLWGRSREARWTEFVVELGAPLRDKGADLRSVQWLTWFVHTPGDGHGTKTFFLDGVRLEKRQEEAIPHEDEEIALESNGVRAVFSRAARFELVRFVTPDGRTLPAATSSLFKPPLSLVPDAVTVRLSFAPEWRTVAVDKGGLTVEYDVGALRHRNRFAWVGGALRVQRRVTCIRTGTGSAGAQPHAVIFGDALGRLTHDHGPRPSSAALPLPAARPLPGNWVAAWEEDLGGVAVIFPRTTLQDAWAQGREFSLRDRVFAAGPTIEAGVTLEFTVWLAPLKPGSPGDQAAAAAKSICAGLAQSGDPLRAYFLPAYQGFARPDRTLVRTDSCAVWEASVSEAVERDAGPPAAVAPGLRLFAARGEVEPLHLVVHAKRRMGRVSAALLPPEGQGRAIPVEWVRARYPRYAVVRPTTEQERQEASAPEQARFVAEIADGARHMLTGRFYGKAARALGPIEDPIFAAPPDSVSPGRNLPIWLTLSVPRDAAPGPYGAALSVREDGAEAARVPLQLTVWRFSLPRTTSLRTWYQLWRHGPVKERWRDYYRNLAEHKVSGFGTLPGSPRVALADGKLTVDWSAFDAAASFLFDELGMRHAKLPHGKRGGGHKHVYGFAGLQLGAPEFEQTFYDYLLQARAHLREKGWLKGIDCYIFDEPDRERIEVIRRTAPIIRRALPEMRVFPACSKNTLELTDVLNAWCPSVPYFGAALGDFTPQRVAAGRARGDVYWWYNQRDNCLGAPVVTHRALLWASWQADLDGYFVWTINNWGNKGMQWGSVFEIGEAMAIYPGRDGPVDSLRWEQTREGLEDYDYLVMLQRAVDRRQVPEELRSRARELLAEARRLFPDPRCQIAAAPSELIRLRQEMGRILDRVALTE